jgi:plasmid stabilization system protein ParE
MSDRLPVEISVLAAHHIRELESWSQPYFCARRRIHISRIWYFLYYRLAQNPRRIEILALWSESRDGGPPI